MDNNEKHMLRRVLRKDIEELELKLRKFKIRLKHLEGSRVSRWWDRKQMERIQ